MLAFRMDEKTLQMMTATDNHTKSTERVRSGIEEAPNEDLRKTIDELAGIVYYMITNKLKMTSWSKYLARTMVYDVYVFFKQVLSMPVV